MKNATVTVGLAIIIAGVAVTLSSFASQTSFRDDLVSEVENEWSISGHFPAGVNLTLYFVIQHDWSLPYYPDLGDPPYQKWLWVNITNKATGNFTTFKVVLLVPRDQIPPGAPYGFLLGIYDIYCTHHGALIADDKPRERIQGITPNDGEYVVDCKLDPPIVEDLDLNLAKWIHDASPPPQLQLREVGSLTTQPYSFLLPIGAATAVVGFVGSAWGLRQPAKSKRHVRRRLLEISLKQCQEAG